MFINYFHIIYVVRHLFCVRSMMYGLLILFLLLPPLMLFVREAGRWRVPLWSLFAFYVLLGWGLIIVVGRMQYEVSQVNHSTQVFTVYFGWIYSAVYFLISMTAAFVIRQFRRQLATGMNMRA